jgi:hypothetical protein
MDYLYAGKTTKNTNGEATEAHGAEEHPLVNLQHTIGNSGVKRMLAGANGVIQTKLTVGAADDAYEQEADAVAKQVMSKPDTATDSVQREGEEDELAMMRVQREGEEDELAMMRVQREGEEDELAMMRVQRAGEEDELAMKRVQREGEEDELAMMRVQRDELPEDKSGSFEVGGGIESQIENSRGGGSSLPDDARGFFEDRMGADFSGVRIHNTSESNTLNRDLGARAFTYGSDIHFADGQYDPNSNGGRELLAHELTHVVQQGGAKAQPKREEK